MFRSEPMQLYSISVSKDNAWEIFNVLGEINYLHFVDLNRKEQIFNRTYAGMIKRCEEAERRIKFYILLGL